MTGSIEGFLDGLSSGTPVPGGGSAAALEAAMAAALVAMVANLTVGRKRYAEVESQVMDIRDRALALCRTARALVQEDADAYSRVSEALGLPRASEEERSERRRRLQEALKGAVDPPLRTMRAAAGAALLAAELAPIGNASAVSDVGAAALAARAAFESGRLNVEINLSSIQDSTWAESIRESMRALPDVEALTSSVSAKVESAIRGEGR